MKIGRLEIILNPKPREEDPSPAAQIFRILELQMPEDFLKIRLSRQEFEDFSESASLQKWRQEDRLLVLDPMTRSLVWCLEKEAAP